MILIVLSAAMGIIFTSCHGGNAVVHSEVRLRVVDMVQIEWSYVSVPSDTTDLSALVTEMKKIQ